MIRKRSFLDKNIQQEENGSAMVALSVNALSVIDDGPSVFSVDFSRMFSNECEQTFYGPVRLLMNCFMLTRRRSYHFQFSVFKSRLRA